MIIPSSFQARCLSLLMLDFFGLRDLIKVWIQTVEEVRHVPDLGDAVPDWAVTFWMMDRLSTFFTAKNPLLFH